MTGSNDNFTEKKGARTRESSTMLPILERRQDIEAAIRKHQVCIICGETGSGKTTQLPQICRSMGLGSRGMIGHTQPRRLAARSVAARISEEMGVSLGGLVGCKVRFGDQTSRETVIKLMTDGILLAETQGDRDLKRYDTIIIDEAHERSLNIDFLLGYLKQLMPRRPDLKLIITSATIDTKRLSDHFGGPDVAPIVEVSGRMYPVEVRYQDVDQDGDDFEAIEDQAIIDALDDIFISSKSRGGGPGDVLVFLPGEREIRNATIAIRRQLKLDVDVLPLYSRLTNSEQDRIFKLSDRSRIVLATNVAETSLTVPGIRYVIDTGLSRQSRYDPKTRVQRLPIAPISQASAKQRAGRCGRVAAGVCYRLYSKTQFESWPEFTKPEILRTNLASVILQMKSLNLGPIEKFPFVEKPDDLMIADGYATLHELGALDAPDATGKLTPMGQRLGRLPVDPRIGRMVLAAQSEGGGCVDQVLALASVLSIQDPRERPMSRQRDADTAHLAFFDEHSDFSVLLKIWDQYVHATDTLSHGQLYSWCRDRFLSFNRMREWWEMERQLRSMLGISRDSAQDGELSESESDDNATVPGENQNQTDSATSSGAQGSSPNVDPKTGKPRSLSDRVHRALLTGLLSNLCCRDEVGGETIYRGSRGNRAHIFPGSVLHRRGPRWLMAAELVQTTRLFARTCAKIEVEWIEELADHVMTKTVSDPHFDKETTQAVAWERATLAGAIIVPRRKVALWKHDAQGARSLFILHALVRNEYKSAVPFAEFNARASEAARSAAAKLRDTAILRPDEEIAAVFESRLKDQRGQDLEVYDLATFERARAQIERINPLALHVPLSERITPEALVRVGGEGDSKDFPDVWNHGIAGVAPGRYEYCLAAGKEEDGISLCIPLLALPAVKVVDCQWLVPGLVPALFAAMLKSVDKSTRVLIEQETKRVLSIEGNLLESIANACAQVVERDDRPPHQALQEALSTLLEREIVVPASAGGNLPEHLQLRLVVEDDRGREIAGGRDIAEIQQRLSGRLAKAQAGAVRARFRQTGITEWSFGTIPEQVVSSESVGSEQSATAYPMLVDMGTSVNLSLSQGAYVASCHTFRGVRRLFAIACQDEVQSRIDALPGIEEMIKQFKPLGSADELRDALLCLTADRVFMFGQGPVRTQEEFESRKNECWGRLGQAAIEVGGVVAKTLDSRFKVAGRLAGGTSRLWAGSIADIREHAAYIMPRGFMLFVPWEQLRNYPRYAQGMRERLFRLKEDGSGAETKALQEWLPHWKKFTAFVAGEMSKEREVLAQTGGSDDPLEVQERLAGGGGGGGGGVGGGGGKKSALPPARKAAPTVNSDAGEWTMRPGTLPAAMEAHRWLLEEYRLALFAPELASTTVSAKKVEESWAKASGGQTKGTK